MQKKNTLSLIHNTRGKKKIIIVSRGNINNSCNSQWEFAVTINWHGIEIIISRSNSKTNTLHGFTDPTRRMPMKWAQFTQNAGLLTDFSLLLWFGFCLRFGIIWCLTNFSTIFLTKTVSFPHFFGRVYLALNRTMQKICIHRITNSIRPDSVYTASHLKIVCLDRHICVSLRFGYHLNAVYHLFARKWHVTNECYWNTAGTCARTSFPSVGHVNTDNRNSIAVRRHLRWIDFNYFLHTKQLLSFCYLYKEKLLRNYRSLPDI